MSIRHTHIIHAYQQYIHKRSCIDNMYSYHYLIFRAGVQSCFLIESNPWTNISSPWLDDVINVHFCFCGVNAMVYCWTLPTIHPYQKSIIGMVKWLTKERPPHYLPETAIFMKGLASNRSRGPKNLENRNIIEKQIFGFVQTKILRLLYQYFLNFCIYSLSESTTPSLRQGIVFGCSKFVTN